MMTTFVYINKYIYQIPVTLKTDKKMKFGYANYTKYSSLSYPMQITLQKKPPAHAAGLQKNCENVNGSTLYCVSSLF
jgi:hypothetical protein